MLIKIGDTVLETDQYRCFWVTHNQLVFVPIRTTDVDGARTTIYFCDAQHAKAKFEKLVSILKPLEI